MHHLVEPSSNDPPLPQPLSLDHKALLPSPNPPQNSLTIKPSNFNHCEKKKGKQYNKKCKNHKKLAHKITMAFMI